MFLNRQTVTRKRFPAANVFGSNVMRERLLSNGWLAGRSTRAGEKGVGRAALGADAPLASDWSLPSSFRANALHCGDGERKSAGCGEAGVVFGVVRGVSCFGVRDF